MLRLSIALLLLVSPSTEGFQKKWRGKNRGKGGGGAAAGAAPAPPVGHNFDTVDCQKCMSAVMRLLVPLPRGCPQANATVVSTSSPHRVPTAYCTELLPKKRACVAYSFGLDGAWDFDKAMVGQSCRVLSFDPLCCGGAHRMGPSHDFIPVGLHTYDGLTDSDDPARPNTTFPVLALRTIMESYEHQKVDVLRLRVGTLHEWKVLKNLVNTGTIQEIRQLSLNLKMEDPTMWEEYRTILMGLRGAGFVPFFVRQQVGAQYLKVQEGSTQLYSAYEVSYGNTM